MPNKKPLSSLERPEDWHEEPVPSEETLAVALGEIASIQEGPTPEQLEALRREEQESGES